MHNQFDVRWLLRHWAGTYARFIAERSNPLKTIYWGLGFGGRIDWRLKRLISSRSTFWSSSLWDCGQAGFGILGRTFYLLLRKQARTLTLLKGRTQLEVSVEALHNVI